MDNHQFVDETSANFVPAGSQSSSSEFSSSKLSHEDAPARPSLPNLTIQGKGKAAGGTFHNVTLQGVGRIDGDVTCAKMTVSGLSKVQGNISAEHVHFQGKGEVGGNMSAARCRIDGQIAVRGNCTSENFVANGAFTIEGMLNSDVIKVYVHGPCRVQEVGGGRIQVQVKRKLFGLHKMTKFTVDTIEADDIVLENTVARVVRGNRVKILSGCDIETVEYKDDFRQDEASVVKEHRQV